MRLLKQILEHFLDMVSLHTVGDERGSDFSSRLLKELLLVAAYFVLCANGQQGTCILQMVVDHDSVHVVVRLLYSHTCIIKCAVGVSLKFRGVTIPNDSIVDIDDIMYTSPSWNPCCRPPSNTNPIDKALLCVTDLEDCCGTEPSSTTARTVHGDWYFPNGSRVGFDAWGAAFLANRGPNEIINGRQFYGSVRLYRRYSYPPERGRFRCELPSAANPNVNQTLYASIGEYIT